MHKKQKTAKNPINKQDNKRFQFALTAALNHEQIKKDAQRIHSSNREKSVILLMIQNRRMALFHSKRTTCIIKRNNVKTRRYFLLFEMPSNTKVNSIKKVAKVNIFAIL